MPVVNPLNNMFGCKKFVDADVYHDLLFIMLWCAAI
jgi:hypothetical protein